MSPQPYVPTFLDFFLKIRPHVELDMKLNISCQTEQGWEEIKIKSLFAKISSERVLAVTHLTFLVKQIGLSTLSFISKEQNIQIAG